MKLRFLLNKPAVIFLLIVVLYLFPLPCFANSILIFSTSHSNEDESIVYTPKGVLVVEVSTFSPITEIRVNDQPQKAKRKYRSVIEIPYRLKPGENEFEILVKTNDDSESKEFVLYLEDPNNKGKRKKRNWKIVSILSLQHLDNIENAPKSQDQKQGTKLGVTLNPSYLIKHSSKSKSLIQGVILREKVTDSDLSDNEISFTQITYDWKRSLKKSEMTLSAGYSDIQNKSAGIIAGENQLETDLFIGGTWGFMIKKQQSLAFSGRLTQKDVAEVDSSNHNGDGLLYTLSTDYKRPIQKMSFRVSGRYDMNDSKGKYQAFDAVGLDFGLGYPLKQGLNLDGSYSVRQIRFIENDPAKGDKETSTLSTYGFKGIQVLTRDARLLGIAETKLTTQDSNIPDKRYDNLSFVVSMVYLY